MKARENIAAMAVTQQQIAERARVSVTLVNFVLNGRAAEKNISEETAQRVVKAAKALGYSGNYLAQALSRGRSFTLGLASISSMRNRMWGAIAAGAEACSQRHAYNMLLIGARGEESAADCGQRFLDERRIDALIVLGEMKRSAPHLKRGSRAVVCIAPEAPSRCASVWMDPAPGIRAAVDHLRGLGHRRILFLGKRGPGGIREAERLEAYREAARTAGVDAREYFIPDEGEYFEELERHIAYCHEQLQRWTPEPGVTAVFCYNDTLALALYAVLQARGMRVPDDLSVIGFDDLHASYAIPALSSISHMFHELGAQAVETALGMVDRPDAPAPKHVLPAKLVLRASTGPAAQAL